MSLTIISCSPVVVMAAGYAARTKLHALLIRYDIGEQRLAYQLTTIFRG